MKKMRRFAAIAAAAAMTACMAMPMTSVWAATTAENDGYTLTISEGDSDYGLHEFEAYQIFTGEMSGGVLREIQWGDAIQKAKTDADGNVVKDTDGKVQYEYDLSVDILAALKGNTAFEYAVDENTKKNYFADCATAADVAGVLGSEVQKKNESGALLYINADGDETTDATDGEGNENKPAMEKVFGDDEEITQKFAKLVGKVIDAYTGDDPLETSGKSKKATDAVKDEDGNITTAASDATISQLPVGYYLIQDTAGKLTGSDADEATNTGAKTRFILNLVGASENTSITLESKSSAPKVMKKVYENNEANFPGENAQVAKIGDFEEESEYWNDVADYTIGDTIPFKLYGTMPSTLGDYEHYFYKFTDTLGKEFTVDSNTDNWEIKVYNATVAFDGTKTYDAGTVVAKNNFNIHKKTEDVTESGKKAATQLTISIEDIKALTDAEGNKITVDENSIITVEYKAVLNENAVIGLDGQVNEVFLTYSNNPNYDYNPITDKAWVDDKGTPEESDDVTENENNPYVESPNDNGTPNNTTDDTEDNTGDTPEDKVIVFTYELDIDKTDAEVTADTTKDQFEKSQLAGAEFVLYQKIDNAAYAVILDNNKVIGWQKGTVDANGSFTADKVEEAAEDLNVGIFNANNQFVAVKKTDTTNPLNGKVATTLTSGEDGGTYATMKVIGLDEGTYYLKETKAPAGYNKLTDAVMLEVIATTKNAQNWTEDSSYDEAKEALTALQLKVDGNDEKVSGALKVDEALGRNGSSDNETDGVNTGLLWTQVVNKKGTSLPTTGGIGTTLFYVIGGTLAAGAGVGLIAKKRMKNEE